MSAIVQGRTGPFEMVIGLEVHAQAISKAKLFSGASTAFGAEPNTQVSFVDAAMPGMLPVINGFCVEQAVKTGLALNAEINLVSVFDRKNYFYPDLPAGYQISQYSRPIVGKGEVLIDLPDGITKPIGITRLHLEMDAGKSVHDIRPDATLIDLNRAGVALMEIVSEPDLRSPEEAGAYVRKLRSLLRYIDTCDGNMEEGSMRCDVNVSVRRPGEAFGTRCEIKNVNSVRFVMRAIEYEAARQVAIIEGGGTIDQETRLFDSAKGETRSMRSKEEAHDYRYFPDPDLLPLRLDPAWVDRLRASLPELPDARKERFMTEYGLSAYNAAVLVSEKEYAAYFEETMHELMQMQGIPRQRSAIPVANWIVGDLFGALNKAGIGIQDSPIAPRSMAGLQRALSQATISGRIAKEVFEIMFETGKDADSIIEEKGLRQVTDTGAIEAEIDKIIAASADKVEQFRAGKVALKGWFVGQVMKATQGKANPAAVNEILDRKLKG